MMGSRAPTLESTGPLREVMAPTDNKPAHDARWRWVRCASKAPLLGCLCERCLSEWRHPGKREGMTRTGRGLVSDRD
jgi:hypothetical protein